ncbi:MAG TPA: phosphoglycerate dehydrogenase [Vicinamibacterales bacterium]|jgi:D-3-phosphoglycerate dehydrogenase|nr:phosphoglycerate dehydrogenase [Vicinamibacterales bacterium]
MLIVIADDLPASAIDLLRAEKGWTVDARPGRTADALAADLSGAEALIVRSRTKVDAPLLAAADRLRVVARAGTGVDNVDLDAASSRGIVVMNAPGANSISVAEHAIALMLAAARGIPRADASMKEGRWAKKGLVGAELRGKSLGIVGLGRIGQAVASRARVFGMSVLAHDPYIAEPVAQDLGVELLPLEELCARADYISLHLPSTAATRHLFDANRLARCKPGVTIVNTSRGDLIDEAALADAIERGHIGGAGLDVFEIEPPADGRLTRLPQVVATPHIAASTHEALELVGLETVTSVRDFLRDGIVRNAVNFPSVSAEEYRRLQPALRLAEALGSFVGQGFDPTREARTHAIGIRYYGALAEAPGDLLTSAILVGLFKRILASGISLVNARAVAAGRGVEVVESRSSRARDFTSLISVKLHTSAGERWVEGAVFEPGAPRLVLVDGVAVEAPLEGTLIVLANEDRPGVIGEVGTILGRHHVNIGTFALGRGPNGAIGVVSVDTPTGDVDDEVIREIRQGAAVRSAVIVKI